MAGDRGQSPGSRAGHATALVLGVLATVAMNPALASPGKGGCGGCGGSRGGNDISRLEASESARDAARSAGEDSGPHVTVGASGRPGEDMGGAIAQLGETEAAFAAPAAWRGRVEEIAGKYGISPALLAAVVRQGSGWDAEAVSASGARGLTQLMPATARMLGVDANDPESNLDGGARYLRMLLDRYGGDMNKALAAYHSGPTRVDRAGGVPSDSATQGYVAAINSQLSQPAGGTGE